MNFAPGDVMIHIFTTGTPDAQGCRILGSPYLIKRGKKYIPQDHTGYWLLTGRCDFQRSAIHGVLSVRPDPSAARRL
jgi:hypothetical protein